VGEEKKHFMSVMFAEPDLDTMQLVRCAFVPQNLSNPTKVFPRPRLFGDRPGVYQAHPLEVAGIRGRYRNGKLRFHRCAKAGQPARTWSDAWRRQSARRIRSRRA